MVDLQDAVVIVTGGASGIGRATTLELAERGAAVVVADVDAEGGTETVAAVDEAGGRATFVEADVTEPAEVQAMVEAAVETYGRLDVGVNNAGLGARLRPTADLSEEEWSTVLDVNLSGVWRCMKHELRQLVDQGDGGAVVNTASVLGRVGYRNTPVYTATKHGVMGLTRTAALEYAADGIRVNAVCPGFVDTPLIDEEMADEGIRGQIEAKHAMRRVARPEEVARAIAWLCSDEASFTTGTGLDVDGGYVNQ